MAGTGRVGWHWGPSADVSRDGHVERSAYRGSQPPKARPECQPQLRHTGFRAREGPGQEPGLLLKNF